MDSKDQDSTAAFERLLRPHLDRLYRLAFRLTGNKPEAEDLFQDVLTKTWQRLYDLSEVREPAAWLCRVMYNHFIDNRRRFARRRLQSVDVSLLPGESVESQPGGLDPDREARRTDDIKLLEKALAALSEEHRQLLLMHDVEGYKLREIQDITGAPIGTLKSRLHRARRRLRDLLAAEGTFSRPASCKSVTEDDNDDLHAVPRSV